MPDFEKAGERHTIFSQSSRAKTILNHREGRPEVHEKRFETPQPGFLESSQVFKMGVKPRKVSCTINFLKSTDREGGRFVMLTKSAHSNEGISVGGGKIVVPVGRKPGKSSHAPGPCVYSPSFKVVESKQGKLVQQWSLHASPVSR